VRSLVAMHTTMTNVLATCKRLKRVNVGTASNGWPTVAAGAAGRAFTPSSLAQPRAARPEGMAYSGMTSHTAVLVISWLTVSNTLRLRVLCLNSNRMGAHSEKPPQALQTQCVILPGLASDWLQILAQGRFAGHGTECATTGLRT
jgi:hypothetical protein